MLARNLQHVLAGFGRVLGPQDLEAVFGEPGFGLFQQIGQLRKARRLASAACWRRASPCSQPLTYMALARP